MKITKKTKVGIIASVLALLMVAGVVVTITSGNTMAIKEIKKVVSIDPPNE